MASSAAVGGAGVNLNRGAGPLPCVAPNRILVLAAVSFLLVALSGCTDSGGSNGGLVDVNLGQSESECRNCYEDDDWDAVAFFGPLIFLLFVVLVIVGIVAAIAGAAGGSNGGQQQQQQVVVVRSEDQIPAMDQHQRW